MNIIEAPNAIQNNLDKCIELVGSILIHYLDVKSLCYLNQINKLWNQLSKESQFNLAWQFLCEMRWKRYHVLKTFKLSNYKLAYQNLHMKRIPPLGKFTESHKPIFGFGESYEHSVLIWLYVNHSADGRLRILNENQQNMMIGNLQLCIQNIKDNTITINLDKFKLKPRTTLNNPLQIIHTCILSKSTPLEDNIQTIQLDRYEYQIIGLSVLCHEDLDIQSEIDFLCMLSHVSIEVNILGKDNILIVRLIDEEAIWKQYVEVPGGLVLLRQA